jgi:hypothetical protein
VRRALGLILLLALAALPLGCQRVFRWWITPDAFDAHEPPPAPDYADLASWAAHPALEDPADLVPPHSGASNLQARARVDVFFVHPTTYYKDDHFNAPIDDPDAARITDTGVMAIQASAFNGAGRVFAPRYRQMALGGYFTADREKGLELAYTDVERAFDLWLAEWSQGRPFVLASHSQGTRHAQTLLERRFAGEAGRPLRERLVAAYLVGGWIDEARLGAELPLPPCESATQTGCVVGWRTVLEDAQPERVELEPPARNLCTNPLSWTRGPEPAAASANLGSLPLRRNDRASLPPVDAALVGARCAEGWLRIAPPPERKGYDVLVRGGDYHVYDYALFHMNVRRNAEARAEAYLRSRH